MSIARARVEAKDYNPNASREEQRIAVEKLIRTFRRVCGQAGISHEYKIHEYYESPGEKKRRKRREAAIQRNKNKLQENFPEKDHRRRGK